MSEPKVFGKFCGLRWGMSKPKVFGKFCGLGCESLFKFHDHTYAECWKYETNPIPNKETNMWERCPQCLADFPVEVKG